MSQNNNQSNRTCRKWTAEEDRILLRYVKARPHNLASCFLAVAEQTGRSKTAVASRWYQQLSKRPDTEIFFTASSQHVAVNRKNGMGVSSSPSIWRRLLNIIRTLR